MTPDILAPAALLALWSLTVLGWAAGVRLKAMSAAGIDMSEPPPGGRRGADLEGVLPDQVNWKAHNYAHLHEQPTVFYIVIAILAITGAATSLSVQLAWAYFGLRVIHSLIQGTVNYVPARFLVFLVSTVCLAVLTVQAVMATL